MPAYWRAFVPLEESPKGWPLHDLRDLIERARVDPRTTEWWRISKRQARVGDRVYVFKQGTKSPRGIFGVGELVAAPEYRATNTDKKPHWRAEVRFQTLVDPAKELLLPLDAIKDIVPSSLINIQSSGVLVPDAVAFTLERLLAPVLLGNQSGPDADWADNQMYDPTSVADERERAFRSVCIRRGQPAFRAALLSAYGGRCAVTGCRVDDILEAAHISPYGGQSTDRISNGLLLRADIHTLFDCGLLTFDPVTRETVIADKLKGSTYSALRGRPLREPKNAADRPSALSLAQRLGAFRAAN